VAEKMVLGEVFLVQYSKLSIGGDNKMERDRERDNKKESEKWRRI